MPDETIKIERTAPQQLVPEVVRLSMNSQSPPTTTKKETYPSEPIILPSQGYFYDESNPLSRGVVDVKYMTAREEDILASPNLIKKGVVLERLLESVIVTPGVKIDDLLIGDKNCIFISSRRLAYGDQYGPVEITCPKCSTTNKVVIDLSKIQNKEYDFSVRVKGENLFEFFLPFSNKTIKFKLLTHKDEVEIDKELENLAKISKNGASFEMTTRLKKMIISVDGDNSRTSVNKIVDQMPTRDSQAFRRMVKEISPDIDSSFDFTCENCGHSERTAVPITVGFFWPES